MRRCAASSRAELPADGQLPVAFLVIVVSGVDVADVLLLCREQVFLRLQVDFRVPDVILEPRRRLVIALVELELLVIARLALLDRIDAQLDVLDRLLVVGKSAGASFVDVLLAGVGGEQGAVTAGGFPGGSLVLALFLRLGLLRQALFLVALRADAPNDYAGSAELLHRLADALLRQRRAVVLLSVLADAAVRELAGPGLRVSGERCEDQRGRSDHCQLPNHARASLEREDHGF